MMFVDDRVGSREFLTALRLYGVPAEMTRLEFADFAFEGRGAKGKPIQVGVERKATKDLIGSLRSGRLQGHQLGGLLGAYDRAWLLIEGQWSHDEHGRLCVPSRSRWNRKGFVPVSTGVRPVMARDLIKQVLTVSLRGGVHVWQTLGERETVMFLSALYHWWTDKDLDEHKSHLGMHQTDIDRTMLAMLSSGGPSPAQIIAKQLPGIGLGKSRAVAKKFLRARTLANATVEELMEVEGVGRLTAERIVEWWTRK